MATGELNPELPQFKWDCGSEVCTTFSWVITSISVGLAGSRGSCQEHSVVSGETAIEASNPEEVIGPYNPWRYLKANFSPATPPTSNHLE